MTSLAAVNSVDRNDSGQGLVKYALIIALMCFAAVVAMQTIAADLNDTFSGIARVLSRYITQAGIESTKALG